MRSDQFLSRGGRETLTVPMHGCFRQAVINAFQSLTNLTLPWEYQVINEFLWTNGGSHLKRQWKIPYVEIDGLRH